MATPSSGLIRLSGIFSELNEDDYSALNNEDETLRLSQMFDGTWGTINTNSAEYPTNENPDRMSEFYNYDHDATGLNELDSSPVQTKNPCGYGTNLPDTLYHSGDNAFPEGSDTIYTNSSGTNVAEPGNYLIRVGATYRSLTVGNSGAVTSITTCP